MKLRPYFLWALFVMFIVYLLERGFEDIATFLIFFGLLGVALWWLFRGVDQ